VGARRKEIGGRREEEEKRMVEEEEGTLNLMLHWGRQEFVLSVQRAKDEEVRQAVAEKEKRKMKFCLDPVTSTLLTFEDEEDLDAKIDAIYDILDEDESGGKP